MSKQRFVSMTSYKGGVGKTTSAIHLGGWLSKEGKAVIVDGDRTRNATYWHKQGRLETAVTSASSIARVAAQYQFILVDSRGGLEEEDLFELAEASDLLILPTNAEVLSLDAMVQTAESLREHGSLGKATVLLTMTRPGKKVDLAREHLTLMGFAVFESTIRHSETYRDAAMQGVLVRDVRGAKSELLERCWSDYSALGAEVMERLYGPL